MAYLIDSNVFISASNLHYGFDFCPAFWDWLAQMNTNNRVYSVSAVYAELQPGADDLADWARKRASRFFTDPDADTLAQYPRMQDWLRKNQYQASAISDFFQVADSALIASALARQWTVVTHETPADTGKKVKIPNACVGMGVNYINPYDMLRRERARFILEKV